MRSQFPLVSALIMVNMTPELAVEFSRLLKLTEAAEALTQHLPRPHKLGWYPRQAGPNGSTVAVSPGDLNRIREALNAPTT